jgi:hypothetical protein
VLARAATGIDVEKSSMHMNSDLVARKIEAA